MALGVGATMTLRMDGTGLNRVAEVVWRQEARTPKQKKKEPFPEIQ